MLPRLRAVTRDYFTLPKCPCQGTFRDFLRFLRCRSARFGVAVFMECGDVTPLLFLCFSCFCSVSFAPAATPNKETKAVLHHRTP